MTPKNTLINKVINKYAIENNRISPCPRVIIQLFNWNNILQMDRVM